ncbi:MAG: hypothetical protein PHR17_10415 [Aminobacterium sp.]|nr:hypothetical protein [Aminobacterium sp.]
MIRTRDIKKLQKALESYKERATGLREVICETRDQIGGLEETLFFLEYDLESILASICAAESQLEAEGQAIYARNNLRPKSESKLTMFNF